MRVLMTGGYGCIGAWVARQLLDEGQDVWIFDLKEDTHRIDLLVEPDERGRIHYRARRRLRSRRHSAPAVESTGATHLLHLAGLQVPVCRDNPILGARVNVLGTLSVFEAAAALKDQVQRVVYASSAAVHGPADRPAGRSATRSGSLR